MATHNDIGTAGETIATGMLRKKGLKIVAHNWRMGHLEVDIIAENKREIVFVEVKTRTTLFGGKTPAEYVDDTKKRNLIVAANAYVRHYNIDKYVRLDVIGILLHPETHEVLDAVHYENAFIPPVRTIGSPIAPRTRKPPKKW